MYAQFVTSWFLFLPLFLLTVSPSWQQGKSGQGERRAWPRNCSQAPAPVQVGLLAGTLLSLSLVLQAKERDVEMHSCLISNPLFFFLLRRHHGLILCGWTLAWPVQKNSPPGISDFWFCLCFGLDIPLCAEVSFLLHFLHFFFCHLPHCTRVCFACTEHNVEKRHHYCSVETQREFVLNNVVSWIKCIKR